MEWNVWQARDILAAVNRQPTANLQQPGQLSERLRLAFDQAAARPMSLRLERELGLEMLRDPVRLVDGSVRWASS